MSEELLRKVRAMAPWHMNIALTPDIRTRDGNPAARGPTDYSLSLNNPRELQPLLERLYPSGLKGKRFLDCACNAGGYSFLASDLGADQCFGFDVREHWIEQARFLKQHFGKTDDQVRFEVCDLLDVDQRLERERFDICLFKGIFYHLPDPVAGLKIVADRTDEVLILDTAAATGYEDGSLKVFWEGVDHPMSGVHNLAWRPTGPVVLARILEWLGFEATCTVFWRRQPLRAHPGRIRIVGARDASMLAELATPPTTSVIEPGDGAELSGTSVLRASVSNDVVEVDRVEFRLTGGEHDDALIGAAPRTKRAQRTWACEWDTTSVAGGTYTVHSVAVDAAGNEGRSAGTTITVQSRHRTPWSSIGRLRARSGTRSPRTKNSQ